MSFWYTFRLAVMDSSMANIMVLYLISVMLFPVMIGVDELESFASGIINVCAILIVNLSWNCMFDDDYNSGVIEGVFVQNKGGLGFILHKLFHHWVLYGFSLALLSPVVGFMLGVDMIGGLWLFVSVSISTAFLTLLGGLGASLMLGKNGMAIIPTLVIPLSIPVIIFSDALVYNGYSLSHLLLLLLLLIMVVPVLVVAIIKSIKLAVEFG